MLLTKAHSTVTTMTRSARWAWILYTTAGAKYWRLFHDARYSDIGTVQELKTMIITNVVAETEKGIRLLDLIATAAISTAIAIRS